MLVLGMVQIISIYGKSAKVQLGILGATGCSVPFKNSTFCLDCANEHLSVKESQILKSEC